VTTLALEACPVCGARDAEAAELGLRRCAACWTTYAAEYADPDEVFDDAYFEASGRFGIDTTHPRFQAFLAEVGARRSVMMERAAGGPGSLLDVGCGGGELLQAAAMRGWRVAGVDPIAQAVERARIRVPGADIRVGLTSDAGFAERSFDVVSAFHVLEHLPDARGFLHEIARFARPGGLVVIESPNFASMSRRRQGEGWIHLRRLEHLVHYTPQTVRVALRAAGLEPVLVTTPVWLVDFHTLDEAVTELAEPRLRRPLSALPVPVVRRAVLRGVAAIYERRGLGGVVFAAARVPA
jgi:SAM-dependent methyltransferase